MALRENIFQGERDRESRKGEGRYMGSWFILGLSLGVDIIPYL